MACNNPAIPAERKEQTMSDLRLYRVMRNLEGKHCGNEYLGNLVTCGECRYCKKKRGTFKGEPIIFYRCTENNRDVEADDFCSYGEREDE